MGRARRSAPTGTDLPRSRDGGSRALWRIAGARRTRRADKTSASGSANIGASAHRRETVPCRPAFRPTGAPARIGSAAVIALLGLAAVARGLLPPDAPLPPSADPSASGRAAERRRGSHRGARADRIRRARRARILASAVRDTRGVGTTERLREVRAHRRHARRLRPECRVFGTRGLGSRRRVHDDLWRRGEHGGARRQFHAAARATPSSVNGEPTTHSRVEIRIESRALARAFRKFRRASGIALAWLCASKNTWSRSMARKNQGEGNREADRTLSRRRAQDRGRDVGRRTRRGSARPLGRRAPRGGGCRGRRPRARAPLRLALAASRARGLCRGLVATCRNALNSTNRSRHPQYEFLS